MSNGYHVENPGSRRDYIKKEFDTVYQFKVTLKGTRPPIWRRIHVPESYTFWDLHVAIQDAMGWEDYHLHEFEVVSPSTGSKVSIGIPSEDSWTEILREDNQKIKDYFTMDNRSAAYVYDFGDNWEHTVTLEKTLPREDVAYPLCTGGKRACPPEDCGGIWGYEELVEVLKNPDHEEYEDMMSWVDEDFDSEYFNEKEVQFSDPDKRFKAAFG